MNKFFTLTAAAIILFTSACKKDDSKKKEEEKTTESTWTLDGKTYTTKYNDHDAETSSGSAFYFFWDAIPANESAKFHSFNLDFGVAPTTSGTYKLVSIATTPTGKQVTLSTGYGSIAEAGTPTGDSYGYVYLGDAIDVNVTVTGGKISVVIPEINVKSSLGGPDVKLKASIKEL
ncbi:MAG: hypothetical protein EOP51_29390 [Sphingobacteriales bacterium]|nr:MAG: hypothetical protein EOP51_29390 [Sphingobacteriales bacterium]